MISNDEFSRIVYERYDEYKKKKRERRRRFVKSGTLCAVAIIIGAGVAFPFVMPRYTKDADVFAPESNGSIVYSGIADEINLSVPTEGGVTEDSQSDRIYITSSTNNSSKESLSDMPGYTASWTLDSEHVLYAKAFVFEKDVLGAFSTESADDSGKGTEPIEYISVGDENDKLGFLYVLRARAEIVCTYEFEDDDSFRRCEILLTPTDKEKTYYLKFYGLYNTEITVKDKEDKQ